MLYRSTPATHARFHAGGISFRFLGSSALSIARLAAVIAPSLLSDVPDFVPVPVSTDHFQRPRWIPWIIRYSTPRCSMLSLPPRRAWSILLRWVRLCWRPSIWTFDKFEFGNVGAFPPRLQRSPADCADRVTRMRYQELLFSAFVLGAAIASDNCRHSGNMPLRHARSTPMPLPQTLSHHFTPAGTALRPSWSYLRAGAAGVWRVDPAPNDPGLLAAKGRGRWRRVCSNAHFRPIFYSSSGIT